MADQVLKGDCSLADEIVQILRGRIINGDYSIGEKLVENKIAEELKVSRTPVREAFKQLTKENLIEYVPNKGCFAKGFEQSDLHDIYAVRNAVEQLAVEWAIKNKTEEDVQKLTEQLEVMALYTENGMVEKLAAADEEFNKILYQMTRSRFIMQALKSYQEYIDLARQGILDKRENLQKILDEHTGIYDAVVAGNVEAAKAAVEHHLRNSAKRAEERWL
ncbi:MAG: GntR family transcriptional regulator [Clostridiales bacterium]|nr:GntR family transcriptional regulator [Clostridiales bacterium]